jgi:hypothetical protein
VRRIYCNPFPAKPLTAVTAWTSSFRPPGIDHGAFVVSPSTVWYARVLLLFLPLQQQTLDPSPSNVTLCRLWKHTTILRTVIICVILIIDIIVFIAVTCNAGWLKSVGSQIVYNLDHRKPVLYVIPIENILPVGKLSVVPVGDTGTIPRHLRNVFPGSPGDHRPDAGDGCKMWFVNSWALGWSRDL